MPFRNQDPESLRARIIGLGEKSIHKSYYPELKNRLAELERFRSMLDQSSEIIFLVSYPNFQILDVTPQITNFLGSTPDDRIGTDFWDIVAPEAANLNRIKVDRQWHETQGRLVFTSRVGERYSFEFVCSPVTFEGQPFVIIVAHEISLRLQAEQKIHQQLFEMDTLHRIDNLITMNLSLPDLMHMVLDEVSQAMKADASVVYILKDSKMLHCIARSGEIDISPLCDSEWPIDQFPQAHDRQIILTGNDDVDVGRLDQIKKRVEGLGYEAAISEPLVSHGRLRGIAEVYFHKPLLECEEPGILFSRLSAQVAVAVEKSQLFNNLQKAYVDLNQAYDETLEGWASALELREKETSNHSQLVVDMTVQLAHAVGIKADELVHVRRGAFLHDIGKMGIPDEILLKPGPLTEEEWVIMRKHPEMACQMLSKIAYLKPALEIPYGHHEKWDGSGYPQGLQGKDIPLAARVFAIVDVWQALTSDRVYRKAWPEVEVLKYIADHRGTHFDPVVVDIFLRMLGNHNI